MQIFDFPVRSIFTFDVFWGSLGTSIFENSSPVTNNIRNRLHFRQGIFMFLMTMLRMLFLIVSPIFTNHLTKTGTNVQREKSKVITQAFIWMLKEKKRANSLGQSCVVTSSSLQMKNYGKKIYRHTSWHRF